MSFRGALEVNPPDRFEDSWVWGATFGFVAYEASKHPRDRCRRLHGAWQT